MFGQNQQQPQPLLGGQQLGQPPAGGLFGGQQQQNASIFQQQPQPISSFPSFGPQQNTGFFNPQQQTGQQPSLFNPLQQNLTSQQQNQAINFQSTLQQGHITQNIKNIPQMIDNLKERKNNNNVKNIFDQLQAPQNKHQLYNFDLQTLMNVETQNLVEGTKVLAIDQQNLAKRLDEFITALGLIESQSEEGLGVIRQLNVDYKELQGAELTLTQTLTRLDTNADNRYSYGYTSNDMNSFQVPQNYEYTFIQNLNKQVEQIGQAIGKLQQFNEIYAMNNEEELERDQDEIVDSYLEDKLQRLANLSHLLFSLQQRIVFIRQRLQNFRNKHFSVLYPDRNRKLSDYTSADGQKDQIQTIVSRELNI